MLIPVLISVAFVTLIERKYMAIRHIRIGPNKVGPAGLLQPFRDAIKLFRKENIKLKKPNSNILLFSPIVIIMIAINMWITYPLSSNRNKMSTTMIIFIVLSRISVFFFISRGWASVTKFRALGAYRSTAQTISYEISILLIIMPSILFMANITRQNNFYRRKITMIVINLMILVIWLITILAETNRTPFDLSERESELVSGYNTEYTNSLFSIIFIAEYSFIIFIRILTLILFNGIRNIVATYALITLILIVFIWTRITLPRIRYDNLMYLSWKIILPAIVAIFIAEVAAYLCM